MRGRQSAAPPTTTSGVSTRIQARQCGWTDGNTLFSSRKPTSSLFLAFKYLLRGEKRRQPLNHWVMLPLNGPNPINPINGPNPTAFNHKFMKRSCDGSRKTTSIDTFNGKLSQDSIRLVENKKMLTWSCSGLFSSCGFLQSRAFAAKMSHYSQMYLHHTCLSCAWFSAAYC